jgi:glycerol kinase
LLLAFNIPVECLPKIISSDEPNLTIAEGVLKGCPLLAVMADSHAALFAHQSDLKITFGTGSSLMAKGRGAVKSGLVPTIAWKLGSETTHALEGNILASGATITYLARLFEKSVADLAELAQGRETDLVLVPAFGGLGAPWWDSEAKALAIGMTLDTDVADFARAGFESMAFQALDLISEFERSTSTPIGTVNVDGGPTSNPWFTQLLADLWQREVVARTVSELSAIGVARLALCSLQPDVELPVDEGTSYKPKLDAVAAKQKYNQWTDALQRSRKGE